MENIEPERVIRIARAYATLEAARDLSSKVGKGMGRAVASLVIGAINEYENATSGPNQKYLRDNLFRDDQIEDLRSVCRRLEQGAGE